MRITEQLSEEDAGEPPSLELPENYHDALLEVHNMLQMYPPYPKFINRTGEFKVSLIDDYDNIEIEASLSGNLAEKYRLLKDKDGRFELEDAVEYAIGRSAVALFNGGHKKRCSKETVVLMNNLPVMFEPINNAMLVGKWHDWEKKKMHITSQYIEDYDQQRLLLGGLAAFVTYLEQQ